MQHLNDYITEALIKKHVSINTNYVDLGLSTGTLWATCNLGADRPEDTGYYYAWAETEPKSNYELTTYKYQKNGDITKYNDTDVRLKQEDDAAYQLFKDSKIIIPTFSDIQDLINNTTYEFVQLEDSSNNINNYIKFKSKSNSNFIILPFGGRKFKTTIYYANNYGQYWTADCCGADPNRAYTMAVDESGYEMKNLRKEYGCMIRPVKHNRDYYK